MFSGDHFMRFFPEVAENPTFPILSTFAYTTGLGDRPACDDKTTTATSTTTTAIIIVIPIQYHY